MVRSPSSPWAWAGAGIRSHYSKRSTLAARAPLGLPVRALDEQAWAWRRSPLAPVPSNWAVRTPSGGRPAGGPAPSPGGEGTAGDLGLPRDPSQAEPVWAAVLAVLAGVRVARAARAAFAVAAGGAEVAVAAVEAQVDAVAVPCLVDKAATLEGRSQCSRCRRSTTKTRIRVHHRCRCHLRRTCTSPCRPARWRSPPSGRGGGCGRAEARTQSGPPSRAEQRVGTRQWAAAAPA